MIVSRCCSTTNTSWSHGTGRAWTGTKISYRISRWSPSVGHSATGSSQRAGVSRNVCSSAPYLESATHPGAGADGERCIPNNFEGIAEHHCGDQIPAIRPSALGPNASYPPRWCPVADFCGGYRHTRRRR